MKDIVNGVARIITDKEYSRHYSAIYFDGANALLNDELLQQIPFLRTIASGLKFAASVRERNLLRQTSAFVLGFDSGTFSQNQIEKYRAKIKCDVFLYEELERVLVVLDRTPDWERSCFLGRCYREFVSGRIKLERFSELREAAERIFVSDVRLLENLYCDGDHELNDDEAYRIERLVGFGLLRHAGHTWGEVKGEQLVGSVCLTPLGEEFGRVLTMPHPIREIINRSDK